MFDITLIHPKLVHFTIALFLVVLILDFIGWRMKNERLHHAAWINLIFAAIAALVTAFTGWLAANNVPHNDAVHEMMETHEALGYWVTGIIVVLLIWRKVLGGKFPAKNGWLFFLVTLVGVGLMSYGASLGGDMVYIHGVGVKAVPVKAHNHNGNSIAMKKRWNSTRKTKMRNIFMKKEPMNMLRARRILPRRREPIPIKTAKNIPISSKTMSGCPRPESKL